MAWIGHVAAGRHMVGHDQILAFFVFELRRPNETSLQVKQKTTWEGSFLRSTQNTKISTWDLPSNLRVDNMDSKSEIPILILRF